MNILYTVLSKGFRNFFSISSLLKLVFLYALAVLYIIITTFDFSPNIFRKDTKHKLAIYSIEGRIGEARAYERTLAALKNMGWDYVGCSFYPPLTNYTLTRHFYVVAANLVNLVTRPEVNIALTHYVTIVPTGYNLVYLNVPDVMLYSTQMRFLKEHEHLKNYDGYIDLYSVTNIENKTLKEVLHNHGKDDALIIPAYLAQNKLEFIKPSSYDKAVITGSTWGCNRDSFRFARVLYKLGQDNILVAYGLRDVFEYLGDPYLGMAEKYGPPIYSLIELQRKGGIALVLHNLEHFVAGIPTSRLAEGIMSGSVVISDNHPFLRKYFGDNILYFDSFQTIDNMYSQIKTHIDWIRSHPQEAEVMTRNAYDIFLKDWTLEVQLQRVIETINSTKT